MLTVPCVPLLAVVETESVKSILPARSSGPPSLKRLAPRRRTGSTMDGETSPIELLTLVTAPNVPKSTVEAVLRRDEAPLAITCLLGSNVVAVGVPAPPSILTVGLMYPSLEIEILSRPTKRLSPKTLFEIPLLPPLSMRVPQQCSTILRPVVLYIIPLLAT